MTELVEVESVLREADEANALRKSGGSIEVESEEGTGSPFTVKLPVYQSNGGEK